MAAEATEARSNGGGRFAPTSKMGWILHRRVHAGYVGNIVILYSLTISGINNDSGIVEVMCTAGGLPLLFVAFVLLDLLISMTHCFVGGGSIRSQTRRDFGGV